MQPKIQSATQRLVFIDILRGLAALWMIETHSVNEYLAPIFKVGFPFSWLNISNGFVSVVFIFCAGAGFWLALERKHDDYRQLGKGFRSYVFRLLFILCIAYLLQTPKFSLASTLQSTPDDILRLLQCNVLHLIVLCSFIALAASVFIKQKRFLQLLFSGIVPIIVLITPIMRSFDPFAIMPTFPATLFAGSPVSLFPLFPWSCYFFAGAATTAFFRNVHNKILFARITAIVSVFIVALVFILKDGLHIYSYQAQWWAIAPEHTLFRIAGALLLFSTFFLMESFFVGRIGRLLKTAGQESLYIYVLQGIIIYGTIGKYHLYDITGKNLEPLDVFALIVAITIFCQATAMLWNAAKRNYPAVSQKYARIALAATLVLFVILPSKF